MMVLIVSQDLEDNLRISDTYMNQYLKALGVILGLFFLLYSTLVSADIHVAIMDTGFCPSLIKSKIVNETIDMTSSVKMDCKKISEPNRRFHGHFVLKKFLEHLKVKSLKVSPLIIFDKNGLQKKEYWSKALQWIKKNKVDVLLLASGLKTEKDFNDLPTLTFAASGQVSGKLRRGSKIWPQSFEKTILIGNFIREEENESYIDPLLLNKKKIDYFIEEKSSSKAVAIALARALNNCPIKKIPICLKTLAHPIKDVLTGSAFQGL